MKFIKKKKLYPFKNKKTFFSSDITKQKKILNVFNNLKKKKFELM